LTGAVPTRSRLLFFGFGAALAVALILLVIRAKSQAAKSSSVAPAPPAGEVTAPPDISNLSPTQRFERLYQRIISAAQSGDQATVTRFMPMAVAAFGMLDTVTVDARYHLAMLELHVGDMNAAGAQADSIKRANPQHLFSPVILAAIARWNKDERARLAAYREFLRRYDAEMAKRLPEYLEHQTMLEEVKRTASGLVPPAS
jgi:hypothetical protein